MRLEKIELFGFKSFADKTTISFDKNFIGIVGPNGSGKSNVIDAVKWVLGEQSAKSLRGGQMSDVIFAGSTTRKPLNVAEVTLTIDNTERVLPLAYDTIAITRRAYRSGDTEYLLNGEKVRMKDIHTLFLDTGIGRDSFSIISQGKVETIFNSKPRDRRGIIEEAAGVAKYKKRKIDALKKLSYANESVERVKDITHELEIRLKRLEGQKEKAELYLRLKEEYEQRFVNVSAFQIDLLSKNIRAYEGQKTELDAKESTIRASIVENEVLEEQYREELQTADRLLTELYQKQTQLNSMIHEDEKNILLLDKQRLEELQEHSSEERKRASKQMEYDRTVQALKKLELDVNALEEQHRTIEKEHRVSEEQHKKLEFEKKEKEKRLFVVEELLRSNVHQSTRILSNANIQQLYGTVADLFSVEEQYVTAISSALGSQMNHMIVETSYVAQDCIQLLKQKRGGRATFIPLQSVRFRKLNDTVHQKAKSEIGYIGIAQDLISYDTTYERAFSFLLGTTLICDTLDHAIALSNKLSEKGIRYITLEGDVIHTTGILSGGAQTQKRQNVVGLLKEKEDLEKFLEENKKEETHAIQRKTHYQTELTQVSQELYGLELQKKTMATALETLGHEASSDTRTEALKKRYDELQERIQEYQEQRRVIEEKIRGIAHEKEEKNHKQEAIVFLLKNLRDEERMITVEQNKLSVVTEQVKSRLTTLLEKINEKHLSVQEVQEMSHPLNSETIDYEEKELRSVEQSIRNLGNVNIDAIEEYVEIEERVSFLNKQIEDLVQAEEKLLHLIETLDDTMVTRFQVIFEKIRTEFQSVYTQLFGGGHADLTLTEPDNLLETGIEIIAQPPGKKLQSISLLSGGEKSLTAIALLFAILRARTVPFCILDEVEAALDEANVERYATFLQHFSKLTQFIVITHRKGTMHRVDSLFGVTMQEKGVSKLLNVQLSDHEENGLA